MSRIRSIKPAFWADEDMASELTRDQRLLYIGLWNLCYDNWTMEYKPRSIKRELFGFDDDVTPEVVDGWVHGIAATGRIVFFEHDGKECIWLPKCSDHQQVNRPQASPLPTPDTMNPDAVNVHGVFSEHSPSRAGACSPPIPIQSNPIPAREDVPEPKNFANNLPACMTALTDRAGTPAATDIRQAFAAAFLNHSPADWGEFCSAVESGCLHGCDGNRKQAVWCYTHILGDPDDPGGYPGKLKLHASPAGFRASRMLLKSMREDRREAPERSKR